MKLLVETIARALVDHPEVVSSVESIVDGATLYTLNVAPDDVGKIIGRDGRTVNAIRTVLTHAAQKKGVKVRLEILDDRRNGTPAPALGTVAPAPPAT